MECKIVRKQSLLPVTSLEFCSVADSRILLAGASYGLQELISAYQSATQAAKAMYRL